MSIITCAMMQDEKDPNQNPNKLTLYELVDAIQFAKHKKKKAMSETDSISSNPSSHTMDAELKDKSKVWTEEEIQMLQMMTKKFGTDFHMLSSFFPKKTKSQIKNKYKHLMSVRKKQEKQEQLKLMAMAKMFKEVQEKQEKEQEN